MAINPLQPPINYMGMAPQLDLAKQFEGFGQALAERQKRTQAEEIKAAYKTDLETVLSNPSISEFNKFALKYPQQREVVKDVASRFTTEQQDAEFNVGRDIAVALENGKPEIALGVLNKTIEARKGSNLPTTVYDQIQQILSNTEDPDRVKKAQAQTNFSLTLLNPEKFAKVAESLQKQKLAPEEFGEQKAKTQQAITEAQTKVADLRIKLQNEPIEAERLVIKRDLEAAEAKIADIEAKYAEQKTKLGLRKTEEDIIINRENARIAALNAAQAKETNVLRRAELKQKIDDATEKRDQADRDQKATLINQVADIDNFVNTATRIKQTPRDIINSATGPIASRLPTTNQDVADFESLVETLGSQAFLAQIPKIKGTGNLTEKEGDKLQASLQNLSLKQSPDRLLANVDEAVRLLEKSRANITARSGLLAIPADVPARELNVTVGGVTYNFPTKAAADTFKNSDAYRRATGTR